VLWCRDTADVSDPGMIGHTLPEIRRLLASLNQNSTGETDRVGSISARWDRGGCGRELPRARGQGVGRAEDLVTSLDFDGAVAAGGADELPDGPAGAAFDEARDGQSSEDDGQVGLSMVRWWSPLVAR
jgi:hypothetical protein